MKYLNRHNLKHFIFPSVIFSIFILYFLPGPISFPVMALGFFICIAIWYLNYLNFKKTPPPEAVHKPILKVRAASEVSVQETTSPRQKRLTPIKALTPYQNELIKKIKFSLRFYPDLFGVACRVLTKKAEGWNNLISLHNYLQRQKTYLPAVLTREMRNEFDAHSKSIDLKLKPIAAIEKDIEFLINHVRNLIQFAKSHSPNESDVIKLIEQLPIHQLSIMGKVYSAESLAHICTVLDGVAKERVLQSLSSEKYLHVCYIMQGITKKEKKRAMVKKANQLLFQFYCDANKNYQSI